MAYGDFIWTDLSAYEPAVAKPFYSAVLGWDWSDGGDGHSVALSSGSPVASLYQMPQKFIDMGMPSFWMSYIEVDDTAAVVAKAKEVGGKVELGPETNEDGSVFALIRDPLGAGFTVIQGLPGTPPSSAAGARAGHGLFVSDMSVIKPFYEALFGWAFDVPDASGIATVRHAGNVLFRCHEIPDPRVRGKEEYWAVFFQQACPLAEISKHGGQIEAEISLPEGPAVLARDPHGAAFIVLTGEVAQDAGPSRDTLFAVAGLVLLLITLFSYHLWPWAIFMGLWTFQGLRHGETYLLTPIRRDHQPLLYWTCLALFAAIAIYSALDPFGETV